MINLRNLFLSTPPATFPSNEPCSKYTSQLNSCFPWRRLGAVVGLSKISTEESNEALMKRFKIEPSREVRISIAEAIMGPRNRATIDEFMSYLQAKDEDLAMCGAIALQSVADEKVATALADLVLRRPLSESWAHPAHHFGARSLAHCLLMLHDSPARAHIEAELAAALSPEITPNRHRRGYIVDALVFAQTERAISALRESAMNDPDSLVRSSAASNSRVPRVTRPAA